ncbi:hypothetical protein IPM62_01410 [Candidatus Woesebacteria bacterium]|nr:MAG: hypothetical protein IPM62_01410 [Candidatus Woesebacteria bacterium]
MSRLTKTVSNINSKELKAYFNHANLKKIGHKTRLYFDEHINALSARNELIKRIKVPENPIKLWRRKGRQVQIPVNWKYFVSAPFIYSMIIPALVWHACIEIYHQVCFRLYGIPLVKNKDYFVYDRVLLSWLNPWEKINCIYCSYINNLIRYSSEIGGRTERYWCPIKYYRRIDHAHSQYDKFAKTKNPKKMRDTWKELRDFSDLK